MTVVLRIQIQSVGCVRIFLACGEEIELQGIEFGQVLLVAILNERRNFSI